MCVRGPGVSWDGDENGTMVSLVESICVFVYIRTGSGYILAICSFIVSALPDEDVVVVCSGCSAG